MDFNLSALSAKNVVFWKCYVDDSARGSYEMILDRDILTKLVLNLNIPEHVIEADGGPL